jgi:hypothetical protein
LRGGFIDRFCALAGCLLNGSVMISRRLVWLDAVCFRRVE